MQRILGGIRSDASVAGILAAGTHRLSPYYRGEQELDEVVWLEADVSREHILALEQRYSSDLLFVRHT